MNIDPFRGTPLALVERAVDAKEQEARDARTGRGEPHDDAGDGSPPGENPSSSVWALIEPIRGR